jgi:hypothetical protein
VSAAGVGAASSMAVGETDPEQAVSINIVMSVAVRMVGSL